ncbi:lipopolysaccharide transport system permease protein [Silvimonas terrae]|uniref:Transport permease protein n=2 Tax=Silvimonas terrae TaxID=300266 RepID=A0A840RJN1_9NEIS|nr:lipopolysaccharide transport system permease protein [Silvimonas terrae]
MLMDLVRRDIASRYRGAWAGVLWSLLNPLLMLAVYTFVFSVVFKARWQGGGGSKVEFALVLFAGLLIFNLYAECVNRAPGLVLANVNFVKKIVFPLELLPLVSIGSALFHLVIGLLVWLGFYCLFFGVPHLTVILLPLVILPVLLIVAGVSWFLAALAVYLRDIAQLVGVLTTVLMFLSPIFYPLAALPERYRQLAEINPLAFAVEQARAVLMWGDRLAWGSWLVYLLGSLMVALAGLFWFQRTKVGFADVL